MWCGITAFFCSGPGSLMTRRVPPWVWIGAGCLVVLVVVAFGVTRTTHRRADAERWTQYPHSMGCVIEPDSELQAAGLSVDPPSEVRVDQVSLTHSGGQRLGVSIVFPNGVPPIPRSTTSPYTGNVIDAPGSLLYTVVVHRPPGDKGSVQVLSPRTGHGWLATQLEYIANRLIDEPVPENFDPDRNLVESAEVDRTTVNLVLDLDGVVDLFAPGEFRPSVDIILDRQGMPTSDMPEGESTMFHPQVCDWETPAPFASPRTTPRKNPPAPPTPTLPSPTVSVTASSGAFPTIVDYIRQAGLVEIPVKRGDPGAPIITLPFPPGWEDAGSRTPDWAYGAIVSSNPAYANDPPSIMALLSKLTGNVDPAKILELAPGEIKNLPGFDGSNDGTPSELSGFEATQIGGTYNKGGVIRAIAQKTVVIPSRNGLYVLQLNADGRENQINALKAATVVIDEQTKITP